LSLINRGCAHAEDRSHDAFLRQVGGSPLRVVDQAVAIPTADPGLTPDEVARLGEADTLATHCG
jgi:hypothetical protein